MSVVLSDLDRDLLARCLSNTPGAWEDFVDRYLPLISHVVNATSKVRIGGLPDPVRDDLVAEIMLGLVDQDYAVLRRFRGQSSLGTYLVVVSRRIAVRKLAKMRRVRRTTTSLDAAGAAVAGTTASGSTALRVDAAHTSLSSADGVSAEVWQMENVEEVQTLLANLPSQEATAIRMFHLENRSYSEIGSHFGIPENSVGPLLSRARDRMRELRS